MNIVGVPAMLGTAGVTGCQRDAQLQFAERLKIRLPRARIIPDQLVFHRQQRAFLRLQQCRRIAAQQRHARTSSVVMVHLQKIAVAVTACPHFNSCAARCRVITRLGNGINTPLFFQQRIGTLYRGYRYAQAPGQMTQRRHLERRLALPLINQLHKVAIDRLIGEIGVVFHVQRPESTCATACPVIGSTVMIRRLSGSAARILAMIECSSSKSTRCLR